MGFSQLNDSFWKFLGERILLREIRLSEWLILAGVGDSSAMTFFCTVKDMSYVRYEICTI